jgi:site-specific DNA-methyltransferase (adenine-specific)
MEIKQLKSGLAELYQGDCLEILPGISAPISAVITDPPYSSGGMTAAARSKPTSKKYIKSGLHPGFGGDNKDQRSFTHWMALWLSLCLKKSQEGAYLMVFSDWRQLPATTDALQAGGWIWRGNVVWNKTQSSRPPGPSFFRHQCEYIPWGSKGPLSRNGHGPWPGCYRYRVMQSDKFHQTGKPTPLLEKLVKVCNPGDVILDPFMGSGTTGVAAVQAGCRFVGIEADPHYFEVAMSRIEEAMEGNQCP